MPFGLVRGCKRGFSLGLAREGKRLILEEYSVDEDENDFMRGRGALALCSAKHGIQTGPFVLLAYREGRR